MTEMIKIESLVFLEISKKKPPTYVKNLTLKIMNYHRRDNTISFISGRLARKKLTWQLKSEQE